MKNLLVSMLFVSSVAFSFSQNVQHADFDKWSLSYGFGSHLWTKPSSSPKANLRNFHISHHELNGRYMFNNRIGAMLDLGFDNFQYAGMKDQKTHFIRVSLQSVVNLGDMMKLNTLHERFGLLLHAGGGYDVMWQTVPKKSPVDNMLHVIIGLTPQLRIAPRWSLKGDASAIVNYSQNNTFDFKSKLTSKNVAGHAGGFINLSVGVTYHIGKNGKHADWDPTFYNPGGGFYKPRY